MPVHPLTVPAGEELRMIRRLRQRVQKLSLDLVAVVGRPLEIGPEDAVVPRPLYLAVGREEADVGPPEVLPDPADPRERGEVLGDEGGRLRPRDDDGSAPAVLRDQNRVVRRIDLAGPAQSPA